MAAGSERISVPARILAPPRPLTSEEREVLRDVADALIAPWDGQSASQAPGFDAWLDRAVAARAEQFETLTAALSRFAGLGGDELRDGLRAWSESDVAGFHLLSSVVAGAYLMVPEVKQRLGYPGQGGALPRLEEAAEQLEDGILDAVIERGPIFVSAAGK